MSSPDGWQWARQAREAAIQMLYQWEIGRLSVPEVADSFWRIGESDGELPERVRERASSLVAGTVAALPTIDPLIEEASGSFSAWRCTSCFASHPPLAPSSSTRRSS
jgi:transcription termination factor NusB